MINNTCLGHSGVVAFLLGKSDLESSHRTRSPHSLHSQRSYIRQNAQDKYYAQYKYIQYDMHEREEQFMMITMVQKPTKTKLRFTGYG
jgi:hypothetical protein